MALEPEVPLISGVTFRLAARLVKRHVRRHFRSVMVQGAERLERASTPLIVYGNHSSWWDPLTAMLLARTLMPARRHYAPMDADALKRYPLLRKMGVFPVDRSSPRTSVTELLRRSEAILKDGGVLWLTPQGRLADVREFPLRFRPGLGALAERMPEVPLLPVAAEYSFWDEQQPRVLIRVGEAVSLETASTADERTRELEGALSTAMLELQKASMAREATAFRMLLEGTREGSGLLGLLQRGRRKPGASELRREDLSGR